MKSFVRHVARVVSVSVIGFSTFAQGTIRFGFEGLAPGSQPPYIRDGYDFQTSPRVSEISSEPWVKAPTPDGEQFVVSTGVILISSPNSQPISEFSLTLYMPPTSQFYTLEFRVQGTPWPIEEFDTWHTLRGTFDTPVDEVRISAFEDLGERFPVAYAIDAVNLVTIPEPGTSVLLLIGGLVAALLRQRRQCLKTRTDAWRVTN